jgi:hypothetical protein
VGGVCSTHGTDEIWYNILVAKPEAKRPLRKPRRRCEDIIRTDLREIGYEVVDWMDLARNGDLVNTVVNLRIP